MRRITLGESVACELDRLVAAATSGQTLFGCHRGSGAIEWMTDGLTRAMAYRLVAEVGVLPCEVITLTVGDIHLEADIAFVTPGMLSAPGRKGLMLPLNEGLRAMLAEFLHERELDEPVFQFGALSRLETALRHDAAIAGLAGWDSDRLAVMFAAKLRERDELWGDDAVEVQHG